MSGVHDQSMGEGDGDSGDYNDGSNTCFNMQLFNIVVRLYTQEIK